MSRLLTDKALLNKVPVISYNNWRVVDEQIVLTFIHNNFIAKFAQWLINKPSENYVTLDKLGTKLWLLIDSKRDIEDVIQAMLTAEPDNYESMQKRVIIYMRQLYQGNLIRWS